MKKTVCILTGTRAEYGILSPLIRKLKEKSELEVKIAVTGTHLSQEFGLTYQEILMDGNDIDKKIDILLSSDTPSAISKSMGLAMIGFADYFEENPPALLIVLGDRYETLAVCCAAMNARIPIAHLHGGELTEGLIDESIRHAITKMSYLHFTSTENYRQRVIQLGESPDRVFNVGAMGVENVLKTELLDKMQLENELQWKLDRPYAVVTFHPVTLENNTAQKQIENLLLAAEQFPDMKFIFTKANADAGGKIVNQAVAVYIQTHTHARLFDSLGLLRYLSAVKYADAVIGNSSSGIMEVPSLHIPTVNIGDRQKGRIQSASTLNCDSSTDEISRTIKQALTLEHRQRCQKASNPYEKPDTSQSIADIITDRLQHSQIELKKEFYNIGV